MQIAIVHYHLNRGGVAQVVFNQLRALAATGAPGERLKVLVVHGGPCEGWPAEAVARLPTVDVELRTVAELDYDTHAPMSPESTDELDQQLTKVWRACGLTADNCLIHVHNHALGKNRALPQVLARWADRGFALLLQIHDFAEDFRPDNYGRLLAALSPADPAGLSRRLYPQGQAVHYAVLNGRDRQILQRAGFPLTRLHVLPNPVPDIAHLPDRGATRTRLASVYGVQPDDRYVLYPVRGIRRKNLGEWLLWGAAHPHGARFAVTLPPLNPLERPRYEAWKQLARELDVPALFEVVGAHGLEFHDHVAAADAAITTSVAEGFGMVFLETWLAGLPLLGRDLPEITQDFAAAGVGLEGLSGELQIPLDWLDRQALMDDLESAYAVALSAYGRSAPRGTSFARLAEPLWDGGRLDFARCSARLQAFVITLVAREAARREQLMEFNPAMQWATILQTPAVDDRVRANAAVVRQHYSLVESGRRLRDLYNQVWESPRQSAPPLDAGSAILDSFLGLPRFHPIRFD